MIHYVALRPLVPYRVPEEDRTRETQAIEDGRQRAAQWLRDRGITQPIGRRPGVLES